MIKEEFDNLVGITTDKKCYEKIEYVYMNDDEFATNQEIADFYKAHNMSGIEERFNEIRERIMLDNEYKIFVGNLAYFAKDYIDEIKCDLAKRAPVIYKDNSIKKMLENYRHESEHVKKSYYHSFDNAVCWGSFFGLETGDIMKKASSYRDVLYDLLIASTDK